MPFKITAMFLRTRKMRGYWYYWWGIGRTGLVNNSWRDVIFFFLIPYHALPQFYWVPKNEQYRECRANCVKSTDSALILLTMRKPIIFSDPQFLIPTMKILSKWISGAPPSSNILFPAFKPIFKFNSIQYAFITCSTCFLFCFTVICFFLTFFLPN